MRVCLGVFLTMIIYVFNYARVRVGVFCALRRSEVGNNRSSYELSVLSFVHLISHFFIHRLHCCSVLQSPLNGRKVWLNHNSTIIRATTLKHYQQFCFDQHKKSNNGYQTMQPAKYIDTCYLIRYGLRIDC